jgi:pyocin large subunit-like protein
MSFVVAGVVQRRKVGSPTRKAILMYMAGCASDDGSGVWTSKSNMAKDLEVGRRTVQRAVDELQEAGLISEVGQRKCKSGYTVEYRVNIEAVERLESTRDPAMSTRVTAAHVDVNPCQGDTGTRVTVAHVPVSQRHMNSPKNHPKNHPEKELPSGSSKKASPEGSAPAQDDLFGSGAVPEPIDDVMRAFQLWNEQASKSKWTPVEHYSRSRRANVKRRLKELGGIEGWKIALEKAAESEFIAEDPSWFKFDWIMKPANLIKLMEGNYNEKRKQKPDAAAEREKFLSAADRWDEEYNRRRGVPEHH